MKTKEKIYKLADKITTDSKKSESVQAGFIIFAIVFLLGLVIYASVKGLI